MAPPRGQINFIHRCFILQLCFWMGFHAFSWRIWRVQDSMACLWNRAHSLKTGVAYRHIPILWQVIHENVYTPCLHSLHGLTSEVGSGITVFVVQQIYHQILLPATISHIFQQHHCASIRYLLRILPNSTTQTGCRKMTIFTLSNPLVGFYGVGFFASPKVGHEPGPRVQVRPWVAETS